MAKSLPGPRKRRRRSGLTIPPPPKAAQPPKSVRLKVAARKKRPDQPMPPLLARMVLS